MSTFYGYDFIFDGTPSQNYGLKIINFGDSGVISGTGSSDVEIYTQKVLRKAKVYYLGRSQTPVLQFSLTFGSENPISGLDRNVISSWLFGKSTYKKLYIMQDDLNGAYFNCFLKSPTPAYVGNLNYAFTCQVVCDSPFAYGFLRTITQTFSGNNVIEYDLTAYNSSAEDDYLYPDISFELNTVGNSFSITNYSDNNREFLFTDLSPEETITVDNDLQVITSSTGLRRLSNFNKKWLRFVKGVNNLHIASGIGTFTITYNDRLKIGG